MATIDSENAKQIRDPMQVHIEMILAETTKVTSCTPLSGYKSFDNTLMQTTWPLRVLADLQGEGFVLDGSAEWYEEKTASEVNGKLAARGNVGENLRLRIMTNAPTISLTITSTGADQIISGGKTFTATGIDAIPMGGTSVDVEFVPENETERVIVSSVVPGSTFVADNSNLIRCEVALRTNLDPLQNTIPASELEFQMYYPEDIGEMFKYVSGEWPVTYQAGYSEEMSPIRYFYLADPPVYENHVITIRAKDQVENLDITVKEGALFAGSGARSLVKIEDPDGWRKSVEEWLKKAGVNLRGWSSMWVPGSWKSDYINNKEGTLRELLGYQMNVSSLEYVDAGIPLLGWTGGTWAVNEEDLASISEEKALNISMIKAPSKEELFDVTLSNGGIIPTFLEESFSKGAILTITFAQKYMNIFSAKALSSSGGVESISGLISFTPSEAVIKATSAGSEIMMHGETLRETGGVEYYNNPNGLGGEEVTLEQPIMGRFIHVDFFSNENLIFSPKNIFDRKRDKITFTFKGDPRWQPRDLLTVHRVNGQHLSTKLEEIHIVHEGGGTSATVTARLT